MLAEFFLRALAAGLALSAVTGPLGCFVVWRRMAYFGETIAHASLLGVALAFLTGLELSLAIFATAVAFAVILAVLERVGGLSTDSLLGILSYSALALGLVAASMLDGVRVDLMSFLFGDILAVSWTDVAAVAGGGLAVLGVLALFWRPLLAGTVSPEIAAAEGLRPDLARLLLLVLIAAVMALSIKIVGVLLITAMLVVPAAAARNLSGSPEAMAAVAAGLGALSVLGGLFASLRYDTPPGPAIVTMALVFFLASLARPAAAGRRAR